MLDRLLGDGPRATLWAFVEIYNLLVRDRDSWNAARTAHHPLACVLQRSTSGLEYVGFSVMPNVSAGLTGTSCFSDLPHARSLPPTGACSPAASFRSMFRQRPAHCRQDTVARQYA